MNDIVKQVSAKTGLSEEHSRAAVTVVVDWVKAKLPEPIRGQVDGFIGGTGNPTAGIASQAAGALGGLFSKS